MRDSMDIENIEEHGFIKLIGLAIENKRFSKKQACEHCGLDSKQFDFIRDRIFILNGHQVDNFDFTKDQEWELSPDSYFQYLQYRGFKHAVKVSHRAHQTAMAAIAISALLAIASIIVAMTSGNVCT